MFLKIGGVPKNSTNFKGKHLKVLFNKVADLKACNFIKKKQTPTQLFPCEFCEISKNTYFYRTPLVAAFEVGRFLVFGSFEKLFTLGCLK